MEIPESRKEWLLYRFSFAGKFDNRIEKYKIWQETSHAVLLDRDELVDQKIDYIHQNPVRELIVANAEEYLYSSAGDYAGSAGMVRIKTEI